MSDVNQCPDECRFREQLESRILTLTERDLHACYVHFNDHQAIAEELARCQARIGELEFQVQHWKECARMQETFYCVHCGGTGGHIGREKR